MTDVQQLKQKRDKLKKIQTLKSELPHLYGFPLYQWQEDFWNCEAALQFIFKANQIGGSSIMIKRMIHFCTERELWTRFARQPRLTIYLYPDKKTATREWETKWAEFMPNGAMKDDPKYGWKENWDGHYIDNIEWNSGLVTYFKTYASGAETMQGSTVAIVACDEELPEELWPELLTRVTGSPANAGAMYWQGCTPTLGQKYLADIQSGQTKLPDSWVKTVSQYDCLKYANGEKSMWTIDHIEKNKQRYGTDREIQIRIYGLFKPAESLAIPQFDSNRHVKKWHPIKGWNFYSGIDYGVGGQHGHPSGIVFVAVNNDYTQARVYKCKRYDKQQTTPDDVVMGNLELSDEIGISEGLETYYDHSAGAIGIISERQGLGYKKANKDRAAGFGLINSLLKNDMLIILDDDSGEPQKLVDEIEGLRSDHDKKRAGDDLVDALRYALSSIPFNWEKIKLPDQEKIQPTKKVGRHEFKDEEYDFDELGVEIDEWNDCYG